MIRRSNVGATSACGHELYCAGHLLEAGIAYHEATGKRKLLDVALRMIDLIDREFGPDGRTDPPGHEEIELALVKLFDRTHERKYLDLARFFVEQRGQHTQRESWGLYCQDQAPGPRAGPDRRARRPSHVPVFRDGGSGRAPGRAWLRQCHAADTGRHDSPKNVHHRRHRPVGAQRGLHRAVRPAERWRLRRNVCRRSAWRCGTIG